MKKFSKIMALSMALALTLGMTVFADGSVTDESLWEQATQNTTAKDLSSGEEVTMAQPQANEETTKEVTAEIEKTGSDLAASVKAKAESLGLKKSAAPSLVFVLDIKPSGSQTTFDSDITVTVPVESLIKKAPGETVKYVLMHEESKGVWKVVEGAEVKDGMLTFKTKSFSNFALFLVEEDTSNNDGNNNGSGNSNGGGTTTTSADTPAPASEPVSPKTGESVPVAGFAALILLAGAAVCAKKVQFNN